MLTPATDQNGSQVNFYYGAPTPYAESIAPSHHSTYAHYYDDEEDGWEMPNFYNETYMKGELKIFYARTQDSNLHWRNVARNITIVYFRDEIYDLRLHYVFYRNASWERSLIFLSLHRESAQRQDE